MKSLLFLAFVAFALAVSDPFVEHFKEISGLNRHNFDAIPTKRANFVCPLTTTCHDIGGTCSTTGGCTTCITNYTNCIIAAAGGANATCVCNQNYVACYNANPACYLFTPGAITSCLAVANCTCPAAVAPPTITNCLTDSYCNQQNSTCVSMTTNGPCSLTTASCGDPVNLFLGYTYSCQNLTGTYQCARAPATMAAGDSCTTSNDCIDHTNCTNGLCVGTPVGGTCTNSASCAFGLWCSAGTCATQVALGGACTITNSFQCVGLTVCGFNNVCVNPYSVAIGGSCQQTAECVVGAFCSVGGTKPATCVADAATPYACNNNTDCANSVYGGTCGCNPANGNPVCLNSLYNVNSAACAVQINNSNACVLNGQCKSGAANLAGTCIYNKCANLIACADLCVLNNNQGLYTSLCAKYPNLVCAATGTVPPTGTLPPPPTGTVTGTTATKNGASTLTFGAGLILAVLAMF